MLLLFLIPLLMHDAASVTVVTPVGELVGQTATDGNYSTFFGVPYALVDENHPFEDTLDYPSFANPFQASDPSIKCPQVIPSAGGILQCLILNIYVPAGNTTQLPVFIWFHGGGLAFGSAGEYNATHLVQENIIVVTANYRLGPYGFLCTGDIKNQGHKDQKAALKWIKQNIQAFGGDPGKVTIGGESWGASAVDFLLYEGGDFKQAIMESGSRFSYGVSTRRNNEAPVKLAVRLGYNASLTNFKAVLKFLNKANPLEVMASSRDLGYVFGLCQKPGHLRKKRLDKMKNTPILIGYNSKEAFADFALQPDSFYDTIGQQLLNDLFKTFAVSNSTLKNLANITWKFYLGEKPISRVSMLELIDLSSDFRVNYGAERTVANYLKVGNPKVFKYVFSYTGGSPFINMTGVGAYHTAELPYLFEWGTPLKTEEQFKMRRWMIKMWTNFIKYGDPTPNHGENGWLPTTLDSRRYLNIDVDSGMRSHVYHQRVAFWDLMWAGYGRYLK